MNNPIKKILSLRGLGAVMAIFFITGGTALAFPPGWNNDVRTTNDPAFSGFPKIAADTSDNLTIVWQDTRDGSAEIYCKKLNTAGNQLVGDTRLTVDGALSWYPAIARDANNNMHVVWLDDRDGNSEIYYTKLDSNCGTIVNDTRLTVDAADSTLPGIAVDANGNLHVVWIEGRDGNSEVYYRKFNGSGAALTPEIRLTTNGAVSWHPSVAVDATNAVHVVWVDDRDGNSELYYKKLDQNGATLVNDTRLTINFGDSAFPSISRDPSNNIHIVWLDDRDGNSEIYYRKLDQNGATIIPDTRLTNDAAVSWFPAVSADASGYAHVVWADGRDGNLEIYYKQLNSAGVTVIPDARLTNDIADSDVPALMADIYRSLHLLWNDVRDGNYELYAKHTSRPTMSVTTVGTTVTFNLSAPLKPNTPYVFGLALGSTPGFPLSDGAVVPLNPDQVFYLSLDPVFMQLIGFSPTSGTLDAQGQAQITFTPNPTLNIPPGIPLVAAFVTIDTALPMPQLVTGISLPAPFLTP